MIALIAAAILTLGGLAGLVMRLRLPDDAPPSERALYSAGPLLLWWVAALLVPAPNEPINPIVKGALLLGMLLAILAVALWQSGLLPSYVAYALLIITYTLYASALAAAPASRTTLWALLLLIPAALLAYWLHNSLAELWWSALIFALALGLAFWHAFSWVTAAPTQPSAWLALLGVGLLAITHLGQAAVAFRSWRVDWNKAILPLFGLGHVALVWMLWLLVLPVG